MREGLAKRNGLRTLYRGTVVRFGSKPSYRGPAMPTILLRDVTDSRGEVVADHLWFTYGKSFARLDLQPGDVVEFVARAEPYVRGYQGRRDDVGDRPLERDYRLSFPTRVRKVAVAPMEELPLFNRETPCTR